MDHMADFLKEQRDEAWACPPGPAWLESMRKDIRARNTPFPPRMILLSMKHMCDRMVPASQVSAIIKEDFQECGVQVEDYTFPSRGTQGEWRAGAEAVSVSTICIEAYILFSSFV